MRDERDAAARLAVDAVTTPHDAQRVDVKAGVGRQDSEGGLEGSIWRISRRFFSPREKPTLTSRSAVGVHAQVLHGVFISATHERRAGAWPSIMIFAVRRGFETDRSHLDGVLHSEEQARLGAHRRSSR